MWMERCPCCKRYLASLLSHIRWLELSRKFHRTLGWDRTIVNSNKVEYLQPIFYLLLYSVNDIIFIQRPCSPIPTSQCFWGFIFKQTNRQTSLQAMNLLFPVVFLRTLKTVWIDEMTIVNYWPEHTWSQALSSSINTQFSTRGASQEADKCHQMDQSTLNTNWRLRTGTEDH